MVSFLFYSTHLTSFLLDSRESHHDISLLLTEGEHAKPVQHSTKGGYVITDYLTYDWLVTDCVGDYAIQILSFQFSR